MNDARTDQEIGRYDRRTGRLTIGDQARVYEVVQALWAFSSGVATDAAPAVDGPRPEPSPEPADVSDGRNACRNEHRDAYRDDGHREGEGAEQHDDAAVFAVPAAPARVVAAPAVPTVPPAVPAVAAPAAPVPASVVSAGRGPRAGGKAGRIVDRRLGLLRRDGWAVLSGVGTRTGADIDRLVVGPPGVFAITVKRGDELPGHLPGGLFDNKRDADFAALMLSRGSGLRVKVTPIVAFVGPTALDASRTAAAAGAAEVLVARAEEIVEVLRDLSSVYSLDERHRIVDAARGASSWGPIAA